MNINWDNLIKPAKDTGHPDIKIDGIKVHLILK